MNKRDINLFKAAGGERAKGSKRSPIFYVVVLAVVVITLALGAGVYFNMRAMAAEDEYATKQQLQADYTVTGLNTKANSTEYQKIIANIRAAEAIDKYNAATSKLYPCATDTEVAAIKATILADSRYTVNDPVEGETFTPWDYAAIRQAIYSEEQDVTNIENDKGLFYSALAVLQAAQKKSPTANVWNGYYRGYMVIVFAGGNSGSGLESVVNGFYSSELETMNGCAPFMRVEWDGEVYTATKSGYVLAKEETYNVVLCPMKSVIDRMFDILEETSDRIFNEMEYTEDQIEFVRYGVDNLEYSIPDVGEAGTDKGADQEYLAFDLILPSSNAKFTDYMRAFSTSVFFSVEEGTVESADILPDGSYSYPVKLKFAGKY